MLKCDFNKVAKQRKEEEAKLLLHEAINTNIRELKNNSFSTFAKFSEKLTFFTH